MKNRKSGFYWIIPKKEYEWEPAEWDESQQYWYCIGSEISYSDKDLFKIGKLIREL